MKIKTIDKIRQRIIELREGKTTLLSLNELECLETILRDYKGRV